MTCISLTQSFEVIKNNIAKDLSPGKSFLQSKSRYKGSD